MSFAVPAPGFSSRAGRWSVVMGLGCYGRHVMRALGKGLGARPPAISVEVSRRSPGRGRVVARREGLAGTSLPPDSGEAVKNMSYVDAAYRAAGMAPH